MDAILLYLVASVTPFLAGAPVYSRKMKAVPVVESIRK
jgi:hypothetical protein